MLIINENCSSVIRSSNFFIQTHTDTHRAMCTYIYIYNVHNSSNEISGHRFKYLWLLQGLWPLEGSCLRLLKIAFTVRVLTLVDH